MVRVTEGPLFSEVVAHFQHFQQTIRIHNVPGKQTRLHSIHTECCCFFFISKAFKVLFSWDHRRAAVLQGLICGTEQALVIYLVAFSLCLCFQGLMGSL